jgi:hypothetical protein
MKVLKPKQNPIVLSDAKNLLDDALPSIIAFYSMFQTIKEYANDSDTSDVVFRKCFQKIIPYFDSSKPFVIPG